MISAMLRASFLEELRMGLQANRRRNSPLPRPGEAFHTPHPRSAGSRNQGTFPAAHNMDERDLGHFPGHEPDAAIRHCIFR